MTETITLPPMAQPIQVTDKRDSVVIASIWPRELRQEEPHCQYRVNDQTGEARIIYRTTYSLPASADSVNEAPSSVRLLQVFDSFQMRQMPGKEERLENMPLHCRAIGAALVQRWTGEPSGANGASSMGLLVLEGREPTTQEVQRLITAQSNYFQERIIEAEEHWRTGQLKRIRDVERMAARWLNMHTKVEWYMMTALQDMKECLSCGGSLPQNALACPNPGCGDLIAKALAGYWSETELKERDPVIFAKLREMRAREKDRERKAEERSKEK